MAYHPKREDNGDTRQWSLPLSDTALMTPIKSSLIRSFEMNKALLVGMGGFLGGFTTFSAFSNETMNLLRGGQTLLALANLMGHIILELGAVGLGCFYLMWT